MGTLTGSQMLVCLSPAVERPYRWVIYASKERGPCHHACKLFRLRLDPFFKEPLSVCGL